MTIMQKERQLPMPEVEPQPTKHGASSLTRLGIFLCVGFVSAIVAANVFGGGSHDLAALLTKMSLSLGLAAWGLSGVVAGPWLTAKRTWVAAIVLASIAFLLAPLWLGKPFGSNAKKLIDKQDQVGSSDAVVSKAAKLVNEGDQLSQAFSETTTCKTLLQPASFASPKMAAKSLVDFEHYATATERLNEQEEALIASDDKGKPALKALFDAFRVWATTTEELYRFAADPTQRVHVQDGVIVIADPDEFNKRMDAAYDARAKLQRISTSGQKPRNTNP